MIAAKPTQHTERPPIVAVLGHVDHGKSTLLDFIRESNIVADEAGGITQHVAAYEVVHEHEGTQKRVTFIDTPGHAAFRAIRERGANVADIAILVVAADDGVKAQTLEALASIKEVGTPFIVAINKIDKPNADVERTKHSLLEHEVYLEGLGGEVPWVAVSAKTGEGIPELLDLVLLSAALEEFKGDTSVPASGFVVEAHRDQKRGVAATLIITNGSLKTGDTVCAGTAIAPVRIMHDHTGASLKAAQFSTPITIIGFDELPEVGTQFQTYTSKKEAEQARSEAARNAEAAKDNFTLSEDTHVIPVVIKADATGSLEAIEHELLKLNTDHAHVSVVQKGIGAVSEGDVKTALAAGTGAFVVHFNVGVDAAATDVARQHNLKVEGFSIIYELADRVQELVKERTPARTVETILGEAKVIKVFSKQKDTYLVGGKVKNGELRTKGLVKIMRNKEEAGSGEILNMQRGKQNVDRIETDDEFGAQVESLQEIMPGDTLVCFEVSTV